MKEIVIQIKSDIRMVGEEPQKMEMTLPAKFYKKGVSLYIAYEETELSGMAGDKTVLKITGKQVTMMRYGSNQSEMKFSLGETYESDYSTPYGVFKMKHTTQQLALKVNEKGLGSLEILYVLEVIGVSESLNNLKIDILS